MSSDVQGLIGALVLLSMGVACVNLWRRAQSTESTRLRMEQGLHRLGLFNPASAHFYVRRLWFSGFCLIGMGLLGVGLFAEGRGYHVPFLDRKDVPFYLIMFFSVCGFLTVGLPVLEGMLRGRGKPRD